MAIQSMVTRTDYKGRVWGARQKVTVDEALTIATINGAYASSEENLKGSITAGKLADFVLLEKDPHDVSPTDHEHQGGPDGRWREDRLRLVGTSANGRDAPGPTL